MVVGSLVGYYVLVRAGKLTLFRQVLEQRDDLLKLEYTSVMVPKSEVIVLEPSHRFVPVLWAGGWDEYLVDVAQIRPMTAPELLAEQANRDNGNALFPTIDADTHIRGYFARSSDHKYHREQLCKQDECVKILRHLGGGD